MWSKELFKAGLCILTLLAGCAKEKQAVVLVPNDLVKVMKRDAKGALNQIGETQDPLPVIRCENIGKDDYIVVVRYKGEEALVADGSYRLTRSLTGPLKSRTNSCG